MVTSKVSHPRKASGKQERPTLVATSRTVTGTRPVRRARQQGAVPGVLYGKATPATAVSVNRLDLEKFLRARAGEHGLLTLRVEAGPADGGTGGKPLEKPVLIKAVQYHPVDGQIVHIDFQAIVLTEQIRVKVPVTLTGVPLGVKQDRGVLEQFLRDLEVECLPTAIPKQMEYDVSAMKIGDTIHVRDLTPPPGVKLLTDLESVVTSVLAPKEAKLEEAAAEASAEPEVIREKKPEGEAGEAAAEGKDKEEKPKAEKAESKKEEKREK